MTKCGNVWRSPPVTPGCIQGGTTTPCGWPCSWCCRRGRSGAGSCPICPTLWAQSGCLQGRGATEWIPAREERNRVDACKDNVFKALGRFIVEGAQQVSSSPPASPRVLVTDPLTHRPCCPLPPLPPLTAPAAHCPPSLHSPPLLPTAPPPSAHRCASAAWSRRPYPAWAPLQPPAAPSMQSAPQSQHGPGHSLTGWPRRCTHPRWSPPCVRSRRRGAV